MTDLSTKMLGAFDQSLLQKIDHDRQDFVELGKKQIEEDFISEMVEKTFSVYDSDHDEFLNLDEFSLFLKDVMESHVS